jgi:hypothetical protein
VGAWGTAIFSNDTSSDLRSEFREFVADGLDATAATERLIESYQPGEGPEDPTDFWLGLALTQHRLGRLLPEVHASAVSAAAGEDLERWKPTERDKRRKAVAQALAELASPQPQPQPQPLPVRVPPAWNTALERGQHLLYEYAPGRRATFSGAQRRCRQARPRRQVDPSRLGRRTACPDGR